MSDQSMPATARWSLRSFLRRYGVLVLVSSPAVMVDGHVFAAPPRAVQLSDLEKLRTVSGVRLSPDGTQVVYTVTEKDVGVDETRTSIWKVAVNGGAPVRIGIGHMPGWSHDGRRISFLRASERGAQLWLIDDGADGAERRVTDIAGGIDSYAWSPDGTRLALVHTARTEEPRDGKASGAPSPWVIDRVIFKTDAGSGYLHSAIKSPRIYLFEPATGAFAPLTAGGEFEESDPAWSPDGTRIAFVSNRERDWQHSDYGDIHVAEARAGSTPRRLTDFPGADYGPAWSPDGRQIVFLQGSDPKYWMYNQTGLAIVPADGGAVRSIGRALDRDINRPSFSADAREIHVLIDDDRERYLAKIPVADGKAIRMSPPSLVLHDYQVASGKTAVLAASSTHPAEIFALDGGKPRALTHHNAAVLDGIAVAGWEDVSFTAGDGTRVSGLLAKPVGYVAGKSYPTILWLHGGPYGQDTREFDPITQWLAANGYAVLAVNYRGSSGRGAEFGRGIFADWGNRDVSDSLAGIDHLVRQGIADPNRLGVGGWSYGGFLTDFIIASDTRFKAAISGAGSGTKTSLYGTDLYAHGNELEFGTLWNDRDTWLRVSRPLFQADRIVTPTLFLHGEKDFNVPVSGSEQMYRALKTLRVPTQMVIYPDEHHSIHRPSFVRDMMQRIVKWYDRYLSK